ncbi:MAG: aminotransferase class III-fold pyridoxal phosphate-dependent enzyme, partial [Ignisphaera sp.]
ELLNHMKYPSPRQRVFHGGTFVGNPITMIAGYTTIDYLARNRSLYEVFNNRWWYVAKKMDKICEEYNRICWITSTGSMIGIHFTSKKPRNIAEAYMNRWSEKVYKALHLFMVTNNIVYLSEKMPHLLPSMAHSETQISRFIEMLEQFLSIIARRSS